MNLPRRRLAPLLLIAFSAVFAIFHFHDWSAGGPQTDETWVVQVTERLLNGEVLYRDTFYGVTPFSIYLQAAIASVFGNELLWVRVVNYAGFAGVVALCLWIGRLLRLKDVALVAIAGGIVAYGPPARDSTYSILAMIWLLLTLVCVLKGWPAWTAGVCAGVAFATKQNVGVFALAAAVLSVRRLPSLAGGFAAVTALWVVPVWLSGAWSWFMEQAFTGKTAYVGRARLSYLEQMNFNPLPEIRQMGLVGGLESWLSALVYYVPLVIPVLIWMWRRGDERRVEVATVLVFTVAAIASLYPRPNPRLMRIAAPMLCVTLAYALARVHVRWTQLACAVLALTIALQVTTAVQGGWHSDRAVLETAHLKGIVWTPSAIEEFKARVGQLRGTGNNPVLMVTGDASLYYLTSGIRNPTRYDFPLSSAFGRSGEQETVERISRGEIRAACIAPSFLEALAPDKLISGIRSHLRAGADLGFCRLYGATASPRVDAQGR